MRNRVRPITRVTTAKLYILERYFLGVDYRGRSWGLPSFTILEGLNWARLHTTGERTVFIAQPGTSFGDAVCKELTSKKAGVNQWRTVEIAVAWANRSGVNKLFSALQEFLQGGGKVQITVGLDFGSTTYEGLSKLLHLQDDGDVVTHVFHDENPACTFHPKVYLFTSRTKARLLVGSNNMTGAGLEHNIEAALSYAGEATDETIAAASAALASWRDDANDKRSQQLTRELLDLLVANSYVLNEEEVRGQRVAENNLRESGRTPLFGRSSMRPVRPGQSPTQGGGVIGRTTGSALGEVLLMRIRPRRNGGQVQISMTILEASFLNGVEEVVSPYGTVRPIGYNYTGGVKNTARFEASEMKGMQNPVARFQWVSGSSLGRAPGRVLQFEIFDAASDATGRAIYDKLRAGIGTPPLTKLTELSQAETVLSTSKVDSSQWYRLDSN